MKTSSACRDPRDPRMFAARRKTAMKEMARRTGTPRGSITTAARRGGVLA